VSSGHALARVYVVLTEDSFYLFIGRKVACVCGTDALKDVANLPGFDCDVAGLGLQSEKLAIAARNLR